MCAWLQAQRVCACACAVTLHNGHSGSCHVTPRCRHMHHTDHTGGCATTVQGRRAPPAHPTFLVPLWPASHHVEQTHPHTLLSTPGSRNWGQSVEERTAATKTKLWAANGRRAAPPACPGLPGDAGHAAAATSGAERGVAATAAARPADGAAATSRRRCRTNSSRSSCARAVAGAGARPWITRRGRRAHAQRRRLAQLVGVREPTPAGRGAAPQSHQ